MKNLIPHFIHDNFKAGNEQGQFQAVTMFMDIAGFTPMTEALMQHGKEGAEILNDILNTIFEPAVEAIYRRGGFVTGFAGDALTAVFIIDENLLQGLEPCKRLRLNALHSAKAINTIFADNSLQTTKLGEFELSVKVGLSFGTVHWGIVGLEIHKAWYFRGQAIDRCALAEHFCDKQDIVIDNVLASRLPDVVQMQELVSNFVKLHNINQSEGKLLTTKLPRITKKIARHFLPEAVINFDQAGEFRNIASVFISFKEPESDDELNQLAGAIIETADLYGGYVEGLDFGDKGGHSLIIFGAPISYEDTIGRALNFITAIQSKQGEQIRAGVTYGTVFAGIKGSRRRAVYGVLGDIVNLSARLMMKSDWGSVLVSEPVFNAVQSRYQFEPIGQIQLKGKRQKTNVYRFVSVIEIGEQIFKGPFVGRAAEMARAARVFDPLSKHQFGGVLYVYGDAGVGKSRLIHELKRKHSRFHWLYLPCDEILRKSFNPIHFFFNRFFEQSRQADQTVNQASFERNYSSLLTTIELSSTNNDEIFTELKRLMPIVAGFLGLRYENSLYDQLDAKGRYENTLYAFKEIVKALSLSTPIVIELEDLHWIDPDSKAAFNTLLTNIADYPLAVIISSRYLDDGTKPTLIDHEQADIEIHEIDLNTLSEAGIQEVAEAYLGGAISENLQKHLCAKTGGNPFFIEQTVRYYQENNMVTAHDDKWELQQTDADLPQSINDLIMARVDRLSRRLKQTVQTAAIVGYEFDAEVLLGVLNRIDKSWLQDEFSNLMSEIERSNIWQTITEMHYVFSHALIRDAVYQMQLRTHLRQVHQVSAEYLEEKYPDNPQVYGELAHHYEQADNRDKTIEYLEKAGDDAMENYRNEEALGYYDRLLQLISEEDNIEFLISTQQKKGSILGLIGYWDEWKYLSQKSVVLAEKINNTRIIAECYENFALVLYQSSNYHCALSYYKKAIEVIKKTKDDVRIIGLQSKIANIYYKQGNYKLAEKIWVKKNKICLNRNDELGVANALGSLGNLYTKKGEYEVALRYYLGALGIFKNHDKSSYALTAMNIGNMYYDIFDYTKAKEYYQKSLHLFQMFGNKQEIGRVYGNLGNVFFCEGDFAETIRFYQFKLNLSHEIVDIDGISQSFALLGELYFELGEFKTAFDYLNKSLAISEKYNYQHRILDSHIVIGSIYREIFQYDNALSHYQSAIDIAEKIGLEVDSAVCLIEIVVLYTYQKKWDEAFSLIKKAMDIIRDKNLQGYDFICTILFTQIAFNKGEIKVIEQLEKILHTTESNVDKALINYELQKMYDHLGQKEKAEISRQTALDLYQELYQKTPKYEYKKRIEELSQSRELSL